MDVWCFAPSICKVLDGCDVLCCSKDSLGRSLGVSGEDSFMRVHAGISVGLRIFCTFFQLSVAKRMHAAMYIIALDDVWVRQRDIETSVKDVADVVYGFRV